MIDPRRAAVLAEATSWVGTPYRHMGRVKGAGTDCLMMLAAIYEACGIVPHIDIPFYEPDWNLHRSAERYLEGLLQYATEFTIPDQKEKPEPGDVALFKFGRCYAHGVIVTDWPNIIHSWVGIGVLRANVETHGGLRSRAVRYFDPF